MICHVAQWTNNYSTIQRYMGDRCVLHRSVYAVKAGPQAMYWNIPFVQWISKRKLIQVYSCWWKWWNLPKKNEKKYRQPIRIAVHAKHIEQSRTNDKQSQNSVFPSIWSNLGRTHYKYSFYNAKKRTRTIHSMNR